MKPYLSLSVHQLVDFLLRSGDIDNRIYNQASMIEGSRIHAHFQKKQGNEYVSEYPLSHTFTNHDFDIELHGRADGIIIARDQVIIDEIKSTVSDLETFHESQAKWHFGQAICYALMYCYEKKMAEIDIRITYIHQITDRQLIKQVHYEVEELEKEVDRYIEEYLDFHRIIHRLRIERNLSASKLNFPFHNFRSGQRELAKYSFAIARNGGTLFSEAPTGIGKTISTLYPFVRSFEDGVNEKIFYLTAKTSGRESAYKAVELLKAKGLKASEIVITAKDKICPNPSASCNPDECPFAKDYYAKIKDALLDTIVHENSYDERTMMRYALKYGICPFEYELDLSLFSDIVICDYNYLFDPLVYMKRYFDEDASRFLVLVDEAHNLVERGRDMYSTSLSYEDFQAMKKSMKGFDNKKFKSAITKLGKLFKNLLQESEEEYTLKPSFNPEIVKALDSFFKVGQEVNKNHHQFAGEEFLSFFFAANRYIKLSELASENFIEYYVRRSKKDLIINLACLDPAKYLRGCLDQVKGRVIFSATLSPIDYYVRILGGKESDPILMLPSPFPKENLLLMVCPSISTRYKNRENSFNDIKESILAAVKNKIGNYLIFFPSYLYLNNVLKCFDGIQGFAIFSQSKEMTDNDKMDFLNNFEANPKRTHLGFAVLGGAFSEGIDLIDDRLIGAIIIGVGLPQISRERDMIKDYHDKKGEHGYDFSYVNPGMNKVMQAVGRVIRSESDRGIVLLIDDRYLNRKYRNLFKHEWSGYEVVTDLADIDDLTKKFWST